MRGRIAGITVIGAFATVVTTFVACSLSVCETARLETTGAGR